MIEHGCRRRTRSWGGAIGGNAKRTCDTQLLLPSVRKALRTLNRGKICTPCMIRGVCAAKRAPSWQDIHVVYPPTAICRAFRMHGAHILPKPAHFEYTAAIYCHEGALFPSEAFFGIHRGKILPSSDTRERITSTYRHRQALGNAFRGHLAVAERPRVHCEHTLLCAGLRGMHFAGICCHARLPDGAPRQHIASKATPRLRKGQHARSHRTPPEPIRGMRRCPAAAVGAAAMKEPGHWRAPSAGCGGALTCGLPGARGHRLLARNPPKRGHGSGAWPTRTRACGCNSGVHTHRRTVRSPDVPRLLQVCTASGRSRQLRARRPLSAEAFGHGPSRARGNAIGCGRYRLQGQLRCKSTNEPVHSNIFPLRYCYRIYLLHNK